MCRGQGRGAADTTVSYVWNVYGIMECAWIMVQRTSWSWCSYLAVAVVRRGRVRADGRVVGGRGAGPAPGRAGGARRLDATDAWPRRSRGPPRV